MLSSAAMEELHPLDLEEAVRRFCERYDPGRVRAALVAGSGISISANGWERAAVVAYQEVFPFPVLSLPGHEPSLTLWRRGADGLLVFNGRFHLYQGYSVAHVTAIPRLAALLGSPAYVATNATGAMDPAVPPGSLVVIRDHINLQGTNPLAGEWGRWRGPMFPDMSDAYDPALRKAALRYAAEVGFTVFEGVYAGVLGPSFETPAEVEMLRRAGGTVVGMSTIQEVIAARHLGMRVLVLSLATNSAAGISKRPLTHEEVLEAGEAAKDRLQQLVQRLVADLVEG